MSARRRSVLVLALGLGLTSLGHLALTAPTPLFDGVFIEDPYRYVKPPPGAPGDPQPVEQTEQTVNGSAPFLAVGTSEVPPQAQVIANPDSIVIPAGTTAITVAIRPSAPTDPLVAGNVYRFTITNQAGVPLDLRPAAMVTIVLRAPQPDPRARVGRFDGSSWVTLPTESGGLPDIYTANVTQLGDFAVILSGAAPSPSAEASSTPSSDGVGSGGGTPTWVLILFAIAAVAIGLSWGLLGSRRR